MVNIECGCIIYVHVNLMIFADVYFMPVANYLCFNAGDYLGRIIAGVLEKVYFITLVVVLHK